MMFLKTDNNLPRTESLQKLVQVDNQFVTLKKLNHKQNLKFHKIKDKLKEQIDIQETTQQINHNLK